jgi:hypothetical protein
MAKLICGECHQTVTGSLIEHIKFNHPALFKWFQERQIDGQNQKATTKSRA